MTEKKGPLVRDLMTRKVSTLRPDQTLNAANEVMKSNRIRHVPIVDGENHLVGLITHRDLLRASISSLSSGVTEVDSQKHLWHIPVNKVMEIMLETIEPDAPVQKVAKIMREKKIGCLPVVDQEGQLVGIITETDLLGLVENM